MITIQSLNKIEFDCLFEAFNQAFADYELQLTKDELLAMITRRGFVAELSFGAFDDDRLLL